MSVKVGIDVRKTKVGNNDFQPLVCVFLMVLPINLLLVNAKK